MFFGFLNVLKPSGLTSQQVVQRIRRLVGRIKVGHTGTLDPLATGVLPLCLGPATRLADYVSNMGKTYRARLQLGFVTDTYDREGQVLAVNSARSITEAMICNAVQSFAGPIMQVPPMYSAIKRHGRPLYELARQGIEIEREPRQVHIYKIEIISLEQIGTDHPLVEIEVSCSKGTYIRSLVHDLGKQLGSGAMLTELVRTRVGMFTLDNGYDLARLEAMTSEEIRNSLISVAQVFPLWPKLILNAEQAGKAEHGNSFRYTMNKKLEEAERILLYNREGRLLAVARAEEDGYLQPVMVFREG